MCAILRCFIFNEYWRCHWKGCGGTSKKLIKQMPGTSQNLDFNFSYKQFIYKMLWIWRFSHPVFDNIFTANIIGMWERGGVLSLMQGCSPLLSQYHNVFHKKKQKGEGGGGRLRTNFFENPLGFLGFCFNPGNSKQNKASPKEISQNCATHLRHFKG